MSNIDQAITKEMLVHFTELSLRKKDIEQQLEDLKKVFNDYFDTNVGHQLKAEMTIGDYKLQRQIRTIEKFTQEKTITRLEELNLMDLIQKKPDEKKIKSALNLGLLKEDDLADCRTVQTTQAIVVKKLK